MSKNILITGSTDGIGKLAAIKLAEAGHTVYLHGRNPEKLVKQVVEIRKQTGNTNLDGFVGDLSYLDRVKTMASDIKTKLPKLDILINNAGVFKTRMEKNNSGLDLRFVVNYLAPVLLTEELMPLLKKSSEARIINLSSAAQAPVSLDALSGQGKLSEQESYAQSKLALTMWSFDLAEQLSKQLEGISVVALNPGSLLNTNMVKEAYGTHWSSADKGANIIYDLAISEEYKGVTGQYFDNDKGENKGEFAAAHADAYNKSKIESLLDATRGLLLT